MRAILSKSNRRSAVAITVFACITGTGAVTTVTINTATELQTIQGFGGATEHYSDPGLNVHDINAFINTEINDMGLSMFRLHAGPDDWGQATRDNDASWMKGLQAQASLTHDTLRFLMSTWTPAAQWKSNNNETGGELATDWYSAFADYLVQFYKDCESQSGARIYAVNFSNEPSFENPFYSCVYSPSQWVAFLKVFQPKVKAALPWIKIMGSCDLMETCDFAIEDAVAADATAKSYLDVMTVHHYTYDMGGTPSTQEVQIWQQAKAKSVALGNKPLIMTETSDGSRTDTWDRGFSYAYGIFCALYYGGAVGWTHYGAWEIVEMTNPHKGYKAWAKHVKPGAKVIQTTSDNANVLALAFKHPVKQTFTVMLLNVGTSSAAVSLSGTGLPTTFQAYRTSASEEDVSTGSVGTSGISLPAQSVTALVYQTPIAVTPGTKRIDPRERTLSGAVAVYRIDGSRVSVTTTGANLRGLATGSYVLRPVGAGKTVRDVR